MTFREQARVVQNKKDTDNSVNETGTNGDSLMPAGVSWPSSMSSVVKLLLLRN